MVGCFERARETRLIRAAESSCADAGRVARSGRDGRQDKYRLVPDVSLQDNCQHNSIINAVRNLKMQLCCTPNKAVHRNSKLGQHQKFNHGQSRHGQLVFRRIVNPGFQLMLRCALKRRPMRVLQIQQARNTHLEEFGGALMEQARRSGKRSKA